MFVKRRSFSIKLARRSEARKRIGADFPSATSVIPAIVDFILTALIYFIFTFYPFIHRRVSFKATLKLLCCLNSNHPLLEFTAYSDSFFQLLPIIP